MVTWFEVPMGGAVFRLGPGELPSANPTKFGLAPRGTFKGRVEGGDVRVECLTALCKWAIGRSAAG